MTSKEKLYTDKRRALLRSCILLLMNLLLESKKSQLKLIDLAFIKKTEQQLRKYDELLFPSSKIPVKIGESEE